MSFEALNKTLQDLDVAMETLAAIGAELRLRREGLPADLRVRARLTDVIRASNPALFDGVTAEQEAIALSTIRVAFYYAMHLLDDPAAAPGWRHVDPIILQDQGQQSRRVIEAIERVAAKRSVFEKTLRGHGALLDVGTGAGWLAIEAAQAWPGLRVVGIDPWKPALDLAHANVAACKLADRIELRPNGIEQLQDQDAFTLVWLPAPFLSAEIMPIALERSHAALAPGGWLVVGLFGPRPDPLGEAVTALRVVRSGGHDWTTGEIESRFRNQGFEDVESTPSGPPTLFVIGRKT